MKKTRNLGVKFKPEPKKGFKCYCDPDFLGNWKREFAPVDPSTAKSQSRWIIFYAGCPVSRDSKLQSCCRPSGPKPERQHDRRRRGMSTLTWEEVTSRECTRLCCSCSKKEIIRLRNDSKLALNWRIKKGVYRVESYSGPPHQLRKNPHTIRELTYSVTVELDLSLDPARMI